VRISGILPSNAIKLMADAAVKKIYTIVLQAESR
jgi:hypothetical protein